MGRALAKLVTLACLWLFGSAAAGQGQITVTDDDGLPVSLARPATRIVSLAPSLTELLYAAGAGAAFGASC